jgi:hypothetical protein
MPQPHHPTESNNPSFDDPRGEDFDETERAPVLGHPGTVQRSDSSLKMNLLLGTAPLVQVGIWSIVFLIWYNVIFRANWIFFSYHPVCA